MFLRKKKNGSGSTCVQIISKNRGKYKVVHSMGSSSNEQEIARLLLLGAQEIERRKTQSALFVSESDTIVEQVFHTLQNAHIRTVGPELIFGAVYDAIGFGAVGQELFRHLTLARLSFPLSKLKTAEYLYRYQGIHVDVNTIYRFLDKLNEELKAQVEQIAFAHTKKILNGRIQVVFYDMTTLYFEASDEDDLRKTGMSKDGKHRNPQIFLGLLVGLGGYVIGYDIFEGNIWEGATLIPFLEKISARFSLEKPTVVADAGLLSGVNIKSLQEQGYCYILGARLKNETKKIQKQILDAVLTNGQTLALAKAGGQRLIVSYADSRGAKDRHNRERGLKGLEKKMKSGRLTKAAVNNRGYNKYLQMKGDVAIEIDYKKYEADKKWDGLKGYCTNTTLSDKEVIAQYGNLWHIEKAFRMSKTDLRIRPIYHHLRRRIEAHICLSFTAYCVYKELERLLAEEASEISITKAAELTRSMYEITFTMPDSKHEKSILLKMDENQSELYKIIEKNCRVSQR